MRTQSLFSGGIQNRYEPGHSGGKISKRASNSYGWLRFSKTYILHRKTIRELNGDDAINRFTPGFFFYKNSCDWLWLSIFHSIASISLNIQFPRNVIGTHKKLYFHTFQSKEWTYHLICILLFLSSFPVFGLPSLIMCLRECPNSFFFWFPAVHSSSLICQ